MLFRRLVFSALLIGVVAGLLLSAVQRWQVIPIIEAAERHEQARTPPTEGADEQAGHSHSHGGGDHEHAPGAWEPAPGLERIGFTVLSNVLAAIGFALIMLAAMVFVIQWRYTASKAVKLDWRHGLLWGLAGYAVFFVAPSLGHPPEIPGSVSAPLGARQIWWVLAAVCTATGIAIMAFGKAPWRWAGLVLLPVPHFIGAPQSGIDPFVGFPPEVAAQMSDLAWRFVWATAIANAVFWVALGVLSSLAIQRFVRPAVV